jgi:hypothetical protein
MQRHRLLFGLCLLVNPRRDPIAGKVAVCEFRPSLPPRVDDFGLVPKGARLASGEPLPLNRAHGHEDVNVKVQPAALLVWRMNCPVRDKAFAREVLADKITHQKNMLSGRQFVGKGDVKAMGKLGGFGAGALAFGIVKAVPKISAVLRPRGGIFWGVDFRMKNAFFVGVVVKPFRPFIPQGITRAVCGSGNNAFDLRSSFDGVM